MEITTTQRSYKNRLGELHKAMQKHYTLFRSGFIDEEEYLLAIRPLDMAIDAVEMSTLKGYLVLKEASSKHFYVLENQAVLPCSSLE